MTNNQSILICAGLSLGFVLGVACGAHVILCNFDFEWETLVTGFIAMLAAIITVLEMQEQIEVQVSQAKEQQKRQEFAARSVLPLQVVSVAGYVESCKKFLIALLKKNVNTFDMNLAKEILKEHTFQKFNDDFVAIVQKCIEYSHCDNAKELSYFIISLQIYNSRIDELIKNIEEESNCIILRSNIYEYCENTTEMKVRCDNLLKFSRSEGGYEVTSETKVRAFLKQYFRTVNGIAGHSELFSDDFPVTLMINCKEYVSEQTDSFE